MSGKCPTRLGHFERQDGAMFNDYALFLRWRRVVPMLATAALLASSVASTPANAQIIPLGPRTFTVIENDDVLVVAGNMFTNLFAGNLLVDVYANSSCDRSGFGEGQQFLGSAVASPLATTVGGQLTGFAVFTAVIPTTPRLPDGTAITATVTSMARGDTSEFSKCFVVDTGTGAPRLTPNSATVVPEQELTYTYTWTLPAPRPCVSSRTSSYDCAIQARMTFRCWSAGTRRRTRSGCSTPIRASSDPPGCLVTPRPSPITACALTSRTQQ
jgi:hypothetical protein